MEQPIISGVMLDLTEAKVTVEGVPDRPGIAGTLFRSLADAGVNVDMIVQNTSNDGATDISFTMPRTDLVESEAVVAALAGELEAAGVSHDGEIAKVSLVGAGMKTNPGVAATMFEVLAGESVNIEMISTSAIRISVIVAQSDADRGVRALHSAFGLDGDVYAAPLPEPQ
jgi:aspartate kinase